MPDAFAIKRPHITDNILYVPATYQGNENDKFTTNLSYQPGLKTCFVKITREETPTTTTLCVNKVFEIKLSEKFPKFKHLSIVYANAKDQEPIFDRHIKNIWKRSSCSIS